MRERELLSHLQTLAAAAQRYLMRRRSRIEQAAGKLATLSPVAILERGYSLIFDAQGALIKDASQLTPGDSIHARLARGAVDARIEAVHKSEPKAGPK
jgi:exodeoxyribonuclease VII large subunit